MNAVIDIGVIALSFYVLFRLTGKYFIASLDIVAKKLNMPADVAGATLMAAGSSAPEFFTTIAALFIITGGEAKENLGMGTVLGSAIFNILVIIGASALVRTAKVKWEPILRDGIFYAISIFLVLEVFKDGLLSMVETVVLISTYLVYLIVLAIYSRIIQYRGLDPIEIVEEALSDQDIELEKTGGTFLSRLVVPIDFVIGLFIPDVNKYQNLALVTFTMSISVIALFSSAMVFSAQRLGISIASAVGISEQLALAIVGLTVLAVGTSIPDLISAVIVARDGRPDMAVSDALGSNIFNILVGIGVPYFILLQRNVGDSLAVDSQNLTPSITLLFGTLIAVVVAMAAFSWKVNRYLGIAFISVYLLYILYNLLQIIGVSV